MTPGAEEGRSPNPRDERDVAGVGGLGARLPALRRHQPEPEARSWLCRRCGRRCEPYGSEQWRHAKPRCEAFMRNAKVYCGRWLGHRGWHRSPDAMAYDRERHQPRMAA